MGKGGGCVPSKKKVPSSIAAEATDDARPRDTDVTAPISIEEDHAQIGSSGNATSEVSVSLSHPVEKLKIFIVFYSMYGHVESLAKKMKKGVDGVDGFEGILYRVPETLPAEVLDQMKAPPKDASIPEISAAELVAADGILFGFPTRFGCMAAQMKAFFDSTGQLWKDQKLAGKPAGFFVSTGTQGGGQETTAWTAITQLAHHGMLFVPIGYTFGAGMFNIDTIRGGSPYGAGAFAGDGSRQPSEAELALAEHQGKYMAATVKKLFQWFIQASTEAASTSSTSVPHLSYMWMDSDDLGDEGGALMSMTRTPKSCKRTRASNIDAALNRIANTMEQMPKAMCLAAA